MIAKPYWLAILVIMLVLLQTVAGATPLTDPIPISFGTGNDVGASLDTVNSAALGDLDNDGDLDIVSGSNGTEDFEIIAWQNDGSPFSGLWTSNDIGTPSTGVQSVVVGDLDNDGDLDVVTGDNTGTVTVWENYGSPFSGAWASNEVEDLGWSAEVALGDLDNDGYLDIVCGTDSTAVNEVVVWENDGTPFIGDWTQNGVGASSATVWAVAVGDLDHDGYIDIVSGSTEDEDYEVIVWQNDHTPFSGTWTANDVGTTNDTVWSVALGDLDQDGYLDIISGSSWGSDSEVDAWENDSTPFSGLWTHNGDITVYSTVYSVAVGDLDKDGDPDIVAGVESGAGTEVAGLQNDGTPFSDDWTMSTVGDSSSDVKSVAVGDLDNDGDLDVVSGSGSPEDYEIIACPNTLAHQVLPLGFPGSAVGASADSVYSVATGDLDNDGDLDVVSGSTSGEDYEVIAWQNDGTPFDGTWAQNDVGTTSSVYGVALGDLDNDGDLDVVSVGSSAATYEIIVWQNDGTPFNDAWAFNNVGTSARSIWEVKLGDLDNDGDLDLATVREAGSGNDIIVWENNGDPFFGAWTPNDVGDSTADVNSLALGDLDNDGSLDIVSASEYGEDYELIAWQNDGTPFSDTWTPTNIGATTGTYANLSSVALGDLDKDGYPDVVSGGSIQGDYEVIAWQNDGTPFLGLWTRNAVGSSNANVSCVALGDLDNDGDLDISSVNQDAEESEVAIWENDDTPFSGLWTKHNMGTGEDHLYSLALADLDNDGDLDLVSGSNDDNASFEIVAWQNRENQHVYLPIIRK